MRYYTVLVFIFLAYLIKKKEYRQGLHLVYFQAPSLLIRHAMGIT